MATRPELANAIRALAMDAVQKANSGHPGMPMGMADIAEVLWNHHLRHNPRNPALARPRPLRAVERPRLDAAVCAAASHRLRPADGRAQALPPAAFEDAGPSGARHDARRRDDDRAARAGPRQRGRHGDRGARAGRASSIGPATTIVDHHTYVFLGDGCLMEGISHEACSLAGTLGPGQADRVLRRQRHLDRRPRSRRGWFTDDTPKRFEAYGWHVIRTSTATTSMRSTRAIAAAQGGHRPADADLLQDRHRQRRAEQGQHRRSARRGAGRQGSRGDAREHRLEASAVRDSRRRSTPAGMRAARGAALEAEWNAQFAAYAQQHPELARRVHAPHGGRAAGGLACARATRFVAEVNAKARDHRHAQGLAERDRSAGADAAGTDRRLGRPRRLESDLLVGLEARRARPAAATTSITACASSAWRRSSNGIALHGGFIPVRRHVPHVLRLLAQRAAHGRADEDRAASSCSRTIRSASAKTGRRTSRSSTRRRCA